MANTATWRDDQHDPSTAVKHSPRHSPARTRAHSEPPIATIPALRLAPTVPERLSGSIAAMAFLRRIMHLEVDEVLCIDGVAYYVINVYMHHHQSRIPTNQIATKNDATTTLPHKHSRPDYRVYKRFTAFATLRHHVWAYAQPQHAPCSYCDAFMHFIVHSWSQPRLLVKLGTDVRMRRKILGRFINEFLRLGRSPRSSSHSGCEGHQAIPLILAAFLNAGNGTLHHER